MSPLVHLLRLPVFAYRYTLSGLVGHGCRFRPTCSEYALEALALHGAGRGLWLAVRRIARCHPWGGSGWDPVPQPGSGRHCRHGSHGGIPISGRTDGAVKTLGTGE